MANITIYQEFSLAKVQKGEDVQFDQVTDMVNSMDSSHHNIYLQLLGCLNEVSSFCLTSLLTSLFDWRNKKVMTN